jgi:hypothetical protein
VPRGLPELDAMLANELAQRLREAIEDLLDMNLVDKRIGGMRKRNAGS